MLDANIVSCMRVGPSGDITRSVDARRAGLEILVDDNPSIQL
jgi:hypothetical protein